MESIKWLGNNTRKAGKGSRERYHSGIEDLISLVVAFKNNVSSCFAVGLSRSTWLPRFIVVFSYANSLRLCYIR